MNRFKILSFDVFQTLVNVNERIPQIWQSILGNEYTEEKAKKGADAIFRSVPGAYSRVIGKTFQDMKTFYEGCAADTVKWLGMEDGRAAEVAYHLIIQHAYAPYYDEVLAEMKYFRENYGIIICSDSSHIMVDKPLESVSYDRAFISDDLCCYKAEPGGAFFKKVLREIDAAPEEILHIGDSSADIIGANAAGIASCWINREGRQWKQDIRPDYEVRSFTELREMLESLN